MDKYIIENIPKKEIVLEVKNYDNIITKTTKKL